MCERISSTEHQETKLASKCRKRQNTRWKKPLLQKFRISSKWEEKVLKAFEIRTFFKKVKNDSPESESEEELTQGTFLLFLLK